MQVDACVAMAAALGVTEPGSTGLGGDCFAIFYDANTKSVSGLNGSGRCPATLSLDSLSADHHDGQSLHPLSVHSVTVPGAAAGWVDAIERWGSMKLADVLAPAIRLAEEGVPIAPITAHSWQKAEAALRRHEGGQQLLIDGRAPRAGEVVQEPQPRSCDEEVGRAGQGRLLQRRSGRRHRCFDAISGRLSHARRSVLAPVPPSPRPSQCNIAAWTCGRYRRPARD